MQHSYQVGYRGYAAIGTKAEDTVLMLCTGGNISVSQDPIMSGGVWGAGEGNISPIAYAWNYLTMDASMNVEIATSENYWERFTSGGYYVLKPEGTGGFLGGGHRTTTSVEASEGSAITGTINFKDTGGGISAGLPDSSIPDDKKSGGYGNRPSYLAGATLVPYWRTCVKNNAKNRSSSSVDGTTLSNVISWSASSNRDVQFLKCCNLEWNSPLDADYVVYGEITGDCSYTLFGIYGLGAQPFHNEHTNLAFVFNRGKQKGTSESPQYYSGNGNYSRQYETKLAGVYVPIAIRNSGSTSMTTGANYVTSEFSFTAIGDTTTCGVSFF